MFHQVLTEPRSLIAAPQVRLPPFSSILETINDPYYNNGSFTHEGNNYGLIPNPLRLSEPNYSYAQQVQNEVLPNDDEIAKRIVFGLFQKIKSLVNTYDEFIPLLKDIERLVEFLKTPQDELISQNSTLDNIPTEKIEELIIISNKIKVLLQSTLTQSNVFFEDGKYSRNKIISGPTSPISSPRFQGVTFPNSIFRKNFYDSPSTGNGDGSVNGNYSFNGANGNGHDSHLVLSNDATTFMNAINELHAQEIRLIKTINTGKPATTIPQEFAVANYVTRSGSRKSSTASSTINDSSAQRTTTDSSTTVSPVKKPRIYNQKIVKPRQIKPKKARISSANALKKYCTQCGNSDTPEWRKGPKGPKTTCNACGLFYSKLLKKFNIDQANDIINKRAVEMASTGEIDRRVP